MKIFQVSVGNPERCWSQAFWGSGHQLTCARTQVTPWFILLPLLGFLPDTCRFSRVSLVSAPNPNLARLSEQQMKFESLFAGPPALSLFVFLNNFYLRCMGLDPLHLALSGNSVRSVLSLASLSFRKAMLSFFVRLLLWVPELSRSQRLTPQSKLQLVPSHRSLASEHHRIKWSLFVLATLIRTFRTNAYNSE